VLGSMRDRDGRPNIAIRALVVVVALLVAGPAVVALVGRGLRVLVEAVL
jgi:hypothetical protein